MEIKQATGGVVPTDAKDGDNFDLGGGRMAMVRSLSSFMPREIASGFSASEAVKRYAPQAWNRASSAVITSTTPANLNFFADDINFSTAAFSDVKEAMRVAEGYFISDPVAGRTVELMAQFSIAGMRHQCNDENVKQYYDSYMYQVGLLGVLQRAFLSYYLSGNVYILKTLVNYKNGPIDPNFKFLTDPTLKPTAASIAEELSKEYAALEKSWDDKEIDTYKFVTERQNLYDKAIAAEKHVWSKNMIPGAFTILDPKAIEIKGPGDFDLGVMVYSVNQDLKRMIEDPANSAPGVTLSPKDIQYQKQIISQIPKSFIKQIVEGQTLVVLDRNLVSSVHRMKLDYNSAAFPLMTRAFKALHMKNRLRELDASTINQMVTQLVVFKVGSDLFPANQGQMETLAQAFAQAVETKSFTLFWNHTIDVQKVPVDVEILGPDKYEVWNNDIRDAFGISPILLGRVDGAAQSAFMSVKGFLENLAQGRQDMLDQFVYPEYHGIALANGFKGYPEVVFDKFKLDDEAAAINVLVKLVQFGIIDYQTAVEDLGYDYKNVLARHTQQAPLKDKGIIRVMAAQTGGDPVTDGRPDGSSGGPGSQPNDRPKSSKVPSPTKKSASFETKAGLEKVFASVKDEISFIETVAALNPKVTKAKVLDILAANLQEVNKKNVIETCSSLLEEE